MLRRTYKAVYSNSITQRTEESISGEKREFSVNWNGIYFAYRIKCDIIVYLDKMEIQLLGKKRSAWAKTNFFDW